MQCLSDQRALYVGKCSIVMDSMCRQSPNFACTAINAHCNAVWSDLDVLVMRCDYAPDTKVLSPPTSPPNAIIPHRTGGGHIPVHHSLGSLC